MPPAVQHLHSMGKQFEQGLERLRIMEETNWYCGATSTVLGGHQSIGIKALLLHVMG